VNDPLRILKADHRQVEGLLKSWRTPTKAPERKSIVEELMTKLSAHMDVEESLVYPSVSTKVGSEDEEEAEVEHGLAREGLDS
jgi:hemerythrin superfamily protein